MPDDNARHRAAVFLDRDGTIIEDTGYVARPEDVVLIPGAARAIARLNAAGIAVLVVSNQSGIGRGYYTLDDYERVRTRMEELLRAHGARIDATYICPHAPDREPPCECRKPGTLLYTQAREALGLDLAHCWYIGDRWRDVAPALSLGGRGMLVPSARTPSDDLERARERCDLTATLEDAVQAVLRAAC